MPNTTGTQWALSFESPTISGIFRALFAGEANNCWPHLAPTRQLADHARTLIEWLARHGHPSTDGRPVVPRTASRIASAHLDTMPAAPLPPVLCDSTAVHASACRRRASPHPLLRLRRLQLRVAAGTPRRDGAPATATAATAAAAADHRPGPHRLAGCRRAPGQADRPRTQDSC